MIDVFERIVLINLERRSDRLRRTLQAVDAVIPVSKLVIHNAVDGELCQAPKWFSAGNGAWGCYRSHLRAIEDALQDGVESVLIVEDDIMLDNEIGSLIPTLAELPRDWGMVYLGGQLLGADEHPPHHINPHWLAPWNAHRCHAYAIHARSMLAIYKHLCSRDWQPGHHIDHHLGRYHQSWPRGVYVPSRWFFHQGGGKSDIGGQEKPPEMWPDPIDCLAIAQAAC